MRLQIENLNDCKYSECHGEYGGQAGEKDGIIFNGENWIVKYPKSTASMKGNNLSLYTTAPLSEYIGSHIYDILGIDVHDTILGIRDKQLVVACKDFRNNFDKLLEVRTLKNAAHKEINESLGKDFANSATGDAVNLEELFLHFEVNPRLNSEDIQKRFWMSVIVDMLLDNNDRNNGNWGVLYNTKEKRDRIAPVYDNGNSFSNKTSDERIEILLRDNDTNLMTGKKTIYTYNGEILSAKKMFSENIIDSFGEKNKALFEKTILKITPLVREKLPDIISFMNNIPKTYDGYSVCSAARNQYYQKCFETRLELILEPAYDRIKTKENEKDAEIDKTGEDLD